MKKLIDLQNKNDDLEFELKTLRYESEKRLQSLTKISDSKFEFIKMLIRQNDLTINVVSVIIMLHIPISVIPYLLKVHTSMDANLLAPFVAKKDILSLHVHTDVRTRY